MSKIIIYTDGGSRGNPGDAAIGVFFPDLGKEYGEAIGKATNNVAEYSALILALKKAKQLLGKDGAGRADIEVRSDSELMVNQLTGRYKLKEEGLKDLFIEVWNLKQEFGSVSFRHVPREENSRADALVNRALDTLL